MESILKVEHLEKYYGNRGNVTKAVDDISFTVTQGEYIGIMGASGSGKTTAACALLAALTARGLTPCAFKSGPDYIDPMFHRAVLGVESHNLDLFFLSLIHI